MAKTHSLYYSEQVTKVLIRTIDPHETCQSNHSTFGTWIDEWTQLGIQLTHQFYETSIISILWKQVFSIENTPSFTTITPYGLFIGLDTTWVIKMKTITLLQYWIRDHWHQSQWYRFRTDLINCHTWSWQAVHFGDNHLWSHGTLSWFGFKTLITDHWH